MKCESCRYSVDIKNDSEYGQIQCDITDKVRAADSICDCDYERSLWEKRERLSIEHSIITDQYLEGSISSVCIICGSTVDNEYCTTKICNECRDAIQFVKEHKGVVTFVKDKFKDELVN